MIRHRLIVATVTAVAMVIAATGILVIDLFERRLVDAVDQRLPARAAARLRGAFAGRFIPDGQRSPDGLDVRSVALIWLGADGRTIAALPSGPADAPEPLPDIAGLGRPDGPVTVHAVGDRGRRFRAVVEPAPGGGSVVIAASLAGVDATVSEARWILLIAGAVVAGIVAVLVWVIVRRGLAPIDGLVATAERIAAGEVGERAPQHRTGSEVGHLAVALNTMLDRLQEASDARQASEERTRRFAADASHELRTPLTSIRGYAELYRRGARSPDATEVAMGRIEHEATRMTVLVDDLLLLARLDQRRPLQAVPVDLDDIARAAVQDARVARPTARLAWCPPAGPLVVCGSAHQLRRVFDNLIANACEHTGPGTSVTVELSSAPGEARLVVRDDGPGMAPDDAAHAFDRFWQGDATIEHPRPGTGLGLAIVAELVAAHHGRIELDTAPGQGTCFTVVLPRPPEPLATCAGQHETA